MRTAQSRPWWKAQRTAASSPSQTLVQCAALSPLGGADVRCVRHKRQQCGRCGNMNVSSKLRLRVGAEFPNPLLSGPAAGRQFVKRVSKGLTYPNHEVARCLRGPAPRRRRVPDRTSRRRGRDAARAFVARHGSPSRRSRKGSESLRRKGIVRARPSEKKRYPQIFFPTAGRREARRRALGSGSCRKLCVQAAGGDETMTACV